MMMMMIDDQRLKWWWWWWRRNATYLEVWPLRIVLSSNICSQKIFGLLFEVTQNTNPFTLFACTVTWNLRPSFSCSHTFSMANTGVHGNGKICFHFTLPAVVLFTNWSKINLSSLILMYLHPWEKNVISNVKRSLLLFAIAVYIQVRSLNHIHFLLQKNISMVISLVLEQIEHYNWLLGNMKFLFRCYYKGKRVIFFMFTNLKSYT